MPPVPLSRERIVAEALAMMDEAGLAEVSLRGLAERLGVRAPSLYWHVPTKAALYAEMSETVFRRCLEAVPPARDWQGWLREFGLVLWRAQHEVRDATRLIMLVRPDPDKVEALRRAVAAALARHGLPDPQATLMQRAVQALVTGWTIFDERAGPAPRDSGRAAEAAVRASLDALIAGFARDRPGATG